MNHEKRGELAKKLLMAALISLCILFVALLVKCIVCKFWPGIILFSIETLICGPYAIFTVKYIFDERKEEIKNKR